MTRENIFEGYISLSRKILHYAGQGLPLLDFQKKISLMVMDFLGAERVEFWLNYGNTNYMWRSISENGEVRCTIQNLGGEQAESPAPDCFGKDFQRCVLFRDLILGCGTVPYPETGILLGREDISSFLSGKSEISSAPSVLIPFLVSEHGRGMMYLESSEEEFFDVSDLNFLEEMAQTLGIAISSRRAHSALTERIKELRCLYEMSQISNIPDLPLESVLRRIVNLVPPAMQYPERAVSRIQVDGRVYVTRGYVSRPENLFADIIVENKNRGRIQVTYRDMKDIEEMGTLELFLPEEQNLLESIAHHVAVIIQRKKAEKDRRRLQEQLRHADRLATIGQLAAGVAHELNEPLGNILGFAQLARKGEDMSSQGMDDLDKIISASLHAREIVRKLLIFARQAPTRKEMFDLNRLVRDSISFFEHRFKRENIDVVFKLRPELPEIFADLSQIRQVITNLFVNAIQAMPSGGNITVSTALDGDRVVLTVQDQGTGMDEDIQKKIFLPFFTTKDVGQGTGLGLSVAHGIVASHRGSIRVESSPGAGAGFIVSLPLNTGRSDDE